MLIRPNDFRPVRWIAFDAVGTLIFPDPPVATAYWQIAQEFGSRLTEAEIAFRFRQAFRRAEQGDFTAHCEADWARRDRLQTSEERERRRWQEIVAAAIPDALDPAACYARLFAHFSTAAAWRCFGDVGPTLKQLRAQGYRLAMASNFDARLHAVRAALPELAPIEACVVSSEVGYRKPSAWFFEALLQRTGCRPGEMLMVGDDEPNDGRGAQAAGLPALLLDRSGTAAMGRLTSLAELPVLLRCGPRRSAR